MRNPNRFGTCYRLKGKRRNPFIARVYLGKKDGKPIYKTIGYYRTKSEGQQALLNYKFNPYNTDLNDITLFELFEKFNDKNEDNKSFYENYKVPFTKLEPLYHFRVRDLKPMLFQNLLDELAESYKISYVRKVRFLINQLLEHAVANEIIPYNFSSVLKVKGIKSEEQSVFSLDEVRTMINAIGKVQNVEMILFMCFTGVRPSEMLNIKRENVDFENNIIHDFGIKTDASKKKRIPIPSLLKSYIINNLDKNDEYLIESKGRQLKYPNFMYYYKMILKELNIEYKSPKSARHFFATFTNNEDINDKTRKAILGHSSIKVTNEVYTHVEDEKIKKEYSKIENAIKEHLTKI